MIKISLTVLSAVLFFTCSAQLFNPLKPATGFSDSLATIVKAYPLNYYPIQGVVISEEGTTSTFESSVHLPGALQTHIIRFHSTRDTTAAYQAVLYQGENYKEAVKQYKNICRQVKKVVIISGNEKLKFSGDIEEPSEATRFSVSSFELDGDHRLYKNFYAEVELLQQYTDWVVRLNLLSRKADNEKFNY